MSEGVLKYVSLHEIRPGEYQPRTVFDRQQLDELIASIKDNGVIQPISLRPLLIPKGNYKYEIVAGERRFRAASEAGEDKIPAQIQKMTDLQAAEVAMIENLHRVDLNPIDLAWGYARFKEDFDLSQKEIADKMKRSEPHVSSTLALLTCAPEIQQLIKDGTLTKSHGKMLVTLTHEQQRRLALQARGKSVTAFDKLLKAEKKNSQEKTPTRIDPDVEKTQREFGEKFGCHTLIKQRKNGAYYMEIHFHNLDIMDGFFIKTGFKQKE
ncbi:MAG: ParB/RepB/Spo0J family partition protein [Chlamydiae bacterium]|nr:ParB/RepB/Spo0J family partition protein [Chlamydiota bacterium]